MAGVQLRNVTKRFPGGTVAVSGVDLRVEEGELFVLVGPSGCGKSTLLHLIAGLEAPTAGEVWIGGRRVDGMDPKDRDVAMVFQSYALYPHMTVRENLAFPLELAGLSRGEIAHRVERTAATLGIGELLDRRPAALSGGQRQRVATGRAIVREPAVFLMDEPLSNLDARLRLETRAEILRLQERLGTTMVYVTHDQTEAMTLADRLAVLRDGAVEQVGTPRELYREPATRFVASFLGSPPINLVEGRLRQGRLLLPWAPGEGIALPERLRRAAGGRSGPVVAGLRPEALRLAAREPEPGVEGPGGVALPVRVALVEWLGAELYVHAEAGDGELMARLPPDAPAGVGDRLELAFDPAELHLFDPETERRLGPRR
ncbi:MAG: ABC transporter ATP-binding protein [Thermoanaerobaculia bacterium]